MNRSRYSRKVGWTEIGEFGEWVSRQNADAILIATSQPWLQAEQLKKKHSGRQCASTQHSGREARKKNTRQSKILTPALWILSMEHDISHQPASEFLENFVSKLKGAGFPRCFWSALGKVSITKSFFGHQKQVVLTDTRWNKIWITSLQKSRLQQR